MTGAEILTRFTADTSQMTKATNNYSASLGKMTKAFTLGNIAAKAISKTIGVITQNMGDAIKRLDTIRNFPKVMSNLGIGADEANDSISTLSEKLKGLPTTLDDAASSVQRLTSKNGDVNKSTKMFLALNNAIIAGGAPAQQQASAIEQLSQAYAKGKPDMMEWRTMMTAMPAQLKQVAIAMGYIDADALGQSLRDGSVSMDDFMETLMKLNEEGVNGFENFETQARNATSGIQTSITNLKTAVVRGVADMISNLDKSLEEVGGISGILNGVGKVAEGAMKGLGDVLGEASKILVDFGKEILPTIQKGVDKLTPKLQKIGEKIMPGIKRVIDKITPVVNRIIENIMPILEKYLDALEPIIDPIIDLVGTLLELNLVWIEVFSEILGELLPPLIDLLGDLLKDILPVITSVLRVMISVVREIPNIVKGVVDFVVNAVKGFVEFFKPVFDFIGNCIIAIVAIVSTTVDAIWNILKTIGDFIWTRVLKPVVDFFTSAFNKIWGIVKPVIDAIKKAFEAIKKPVEKVFTGIRDTISNIFNALANLVKVPINAIIDGINKVLKKINSIKIPDWVPGMGGKHTNFAMIPKLATGTNYVPQDTLAMIHEGEAVVPKKFNPYANGIRPQTISSMNTISPVINITLNNNMEFDPLGQLVSNIKTFSGGAKNDYNYGVGR